MRTYNTKIKEIDFKDLDPAQKEKYLKILEEQKIKMTYDIEDEEYLAILKIDKEKPKPKLDLVRTKKGKA